MQLRLQQHRPTFAPIESRRPFTLTLATQRLQRLQRTCFASDDTTCHARQLHPPGFRFQHHISCWRAHTHHRHQHGAQLMSHTFCDIHTAGQAKANLRNLISTVRPSPASVQPAAPAQRCVGSTHNTDEAEPPSTSRIIAELHSNVGSSGPI